MTPAQVRSTAVIALQSLGLQPQNWAKGGIASSVMTACSNVLAALSGQLSGAIAQQWNPTASGGGLQLLSQYFFGLTPPQPTFANGLLTFVNVGGGTYTFAIGQFQVASTVANAAGVYPVYTNTAPFTVLPLSTLVGVPIECTTVGSQGNANPGFVSNIITQMLGVTCQNPAAVVGSDGLTDPALRQLNTNSLGVRGSNFGPRSAYAYAIQTAVNAVTGAPVNVNRWQISLSSHQGQVTIYVASPAGPVITTDLEGISNNIEALSRPDTVTVLPGLAGFPSAPASAGVVDYGPAVTVYVLVSTSAIKAASPNLSVGIPTAASLQAAILAAVEAWFESPQNPIGGLTASDDLLVNFDGIFESGVIGIIGAAVSDVLGATMMSCRFVGVHDLALATGEVAVWTGSVTVQVQIGA